METTATFVFNKNPFKISCKSDQKMGEIFSLFATEFKVDKNDFEFYYNGKKIDEDSTYISHTIANNIEISIKKKSKIMKCPSCICNNCLIKIKNYKLNFSQCCHNHKKQKIFEEYEETQSINYDRIKCDANNCNKKQINSLEDFYKCMECSVLIGSAKYYCEKCQNEHAQTNSHNLKKYDEKYYYCPIKDHYNEYVSYCTKCELNLCAKCEESHDKNHEIKKLDEMNPDIIKIKENLKEIQKMTNNLKIIVGHIKNMMDHSLKIIEKYYEIARDIIGKYESYNKKLKNYQVIETIRCLSDSNEEIMKDLNTIIKGNKTKEDWTNKCKKLIEIFKCDRELYAGISEKIDESGNSNINGSQEIDVSTLIKNSPTFSTFHPDNEKNEKINQ